MRVLTVLLVLSLTGCALHHSGQLRAPRVGAVPPIASAQFVAGQIVFAPQFVSKQLEVWSVRGCPGSAVPIETIYGIAAAHGISYLEPATAATILATRTALGIAIQIGGYATGGAAVGVELAKSSTPWVTGLSFASAILGWLVPTLERAAPAVQCNGQDLMVDSRGCGGVLICSQPSAVGAFSEVSKSEAVK